MTSVLILGGARSGKSAYAERLVSTLHRVRYVAPGPVPDGTDVEWAARVAAHRARRPATWETVEVGDVAAVLASADERTGVFVDCLGTWLTRILDDAGAWERPDAAAAVAREATEGLVGALAGVRDGVDVVLVSPEAGLGVAPATPSGRLFRDALGRLNEAVADACDRVALVVAGRVLDLTHAPRAGQAPPLPPRRTMA